MSNGVLVWLNLLDGPDEADYATCVRAANALPATYAFVNLYEVRDAVVRHLRTNPQPQHVERLRTVLRLISEDEDALDWYGADALPEVSFDWGARVEVLCLAAIATLNQGQPANAKESWVANGDAARNYLFSALNEDPSHNLARVLQQQGDQLLHVSGGVA